MKDNNRHLTAAERKILFALIDECGAPEILRFIGQYVAVVTDDMVMGNRRRMQICTIAKEIAKS